MPRVSISLEDEVHHELEVTAEDQRVTMSEVVRAALLSYFATETSWGKSIGEVAEDAIKNGLSNAEVLKKVKAKFPEASTSSSSISWYRSRMRAKDPTIPSDLNARRSKS